MTKKHPLDASCCNSPKLTNQSNKEKQGLVVTPQLTSTNNHHQVVATSSSNAVTTTSTKKNVASTNGDSEKQKNGDGKNDDGESKKKEGTTDSESHNKESEQSNRYCHQQRGGGKPTRSNPNQNSRIWSGGFEWLDQSTPFFGIPNGVQPSSWTWIWKMTLVAQAQDHNF